MDLKEKNEVRELILRARDRDNLAFEELVSRYTPLMNKLVSAFAGHPLERDELFAEACVGLHSATLRYDLDQEEVTFGLYANVCIRNRLIDFVRSLERAPLADSSELDDVADGEHIDVRLEERETVERLMAIASRVLSDYEHRVLLLYMQGYKTGAIAKALGRTPKSVDNAKSRIFRRLRAAASDISGQN